MSAHAAAGVQHDARDAESTHLVAIAVSVTEPAPLVVGEASAPAPEGALDESFEFVLLPHEAFGLALHPSVMGLTNERRVGSGGFAVLSHQGRLVEGEGYWRASVGVEAAPIPALRLGVAHSVDVAEAGLVPAQRGDRDLLAWVGYRLLARDQHSLYAELAAWFPTGGAREGIAVVRFAPSLALSVRVGERLLVRTRQGALLAAGEDGPFLWASAYGLDVRLLRALYVGVELDSSLGRAAGDLFAAFGAGVGLSALVGPAAFSLGLRYGLSDDFQESVGRFTLSAGVRVALE